MPQLGIEHLKNLATVFFGIVKAIATSTADGFQITDAFSIIPSLMPIPGILKDKASIGAEWADRDPAEKAELIAHIQSLDAGLSNAKATAIAEDLLSGGVYILSAVTKYQAAA